MTMLIFGLLLFIGVHSVRMLAPDWRAKVMQQLGPMAWKGGYTLISVLGLVLIVWGFAAARQNPQFLWGPPLGLRHFTISLNLLAFILLAAAYVPANHIKAKLGHPMVLGVACWALAHLMATGLLAHLLLFGSFLIWSGVNFALSRQRDRREGTVYPAGRVSMSVLTVVIGVAAWVLFAWVLHGLLIGIRPLA